MFITNLGVKGWTDHATLAERRDDLISVTLRGDRNGRPAVDYTVNPAIGFPMATGPEGSADPVAHALPAWDCMAGNMVVSSLLAAERHRLRKGEGQAVDLTLKDAAAAMLGNLGIIGEVAINGESRGKSGNALYGAYGQDFICADGKRVMVIGLTARQWKNLLRVTETTEAMAQLAAQLGTDLMDEGNRWTHRAAITQVFAHWFAARRVPEFAETFDKSGVTWSVFRSFGEALAEDPDLSADNPIFSHVHQPGIGRYLTPGLPMSFDRHDRETPRPAPVLGQHTEEILADVANLPANVIARLFDDGIIGTGDEETRMAS